jgi:TfoX/Sxy family transcriptional regulator of competence genes
MQLTIADYAPDLPPNNSSGASANIVNLFPRTKESWGPVGTLSNFSSNGLASQCLGALMAIDTGGNNYLFAGDATSLYLLAPGNTAFANVSKGGGYTLPIWRALEFHAIRSKRHRRGAGSESSVVQAEFERAVCRPRRHSAAGSLHHDDPRLGHGGEHV